MLANEVKRVRLESGMSFEKLSGKLVEAGFPHLDVKALMAIEADERGASDREIQALANALDVKAIVLLGTPAWLT